MINRILPYLLVPAYLLIAPIAQAESGGQGDGETGNPDGGEEVDEPVSVVTGEVEKTSTDLYLHDTMPVHLIRIYRSANYFGSLGYNWRFNYENKLIVKPKSNEITEVTEQNTVRQYVDNLDGTYTPPKGVRDALTKNDDGSFTLSSKGLVRTFSKPDENDVCVLQSIVDRNGNALRFSHTSTGLLESITTTTGKRVDFFYDERKRVARAEDSLKRFITYEYSPQGNLVRVTKWTGAVSEYSYGEGSQIALVTSEKFPDGAVWRHEYDENGRCIAVMDPYDRKSKFVYHNGSTEVTDRRGFATTFFYDKDRNTTKKEHPSGQTEKSSYDYDKNRTRYEDPKGVVSTFEYDTKGDPTLSSDPVLGSYSIARAGGGSNSTKVTDAEGKTSELIYDGQGHLVGFRKFSGTTEYEYHKSGYLKAIRHANGLSTEYERYDNGLLKSIKDPLGHVHYHEYDPFGNEVLERWPDGALFTATYDAGGYQTSMTYPSGSSVGFTRNFSGRITAILDERNNTTSYEYDLLGNPAKVTYPDGLTEEYKHDANSNAVRYKNRSDAVIEYEYDSMNRLVRRTAPSGTTELIYEKGLLTKATNPSGTFAYEYDANGTLRSSAFDTWKVSYEYDTMRRMKRLIYPDGYAVEFAYDRTNFPVVIRAGDKPLVEYAYDVMNRKLSAKFSNGVTSSYEYDAVGQVISLKYVFKNDTIHHRYDYDAGGNLRAAQHDARELRYEYDKNRQLTKVTEDQDVIFETRYDPSGNRSFGEEDNVDGLNRYTKFSGQEVRYDRNGNVTYFNGITYSYDAENQLIEATSDVGKAQFSYDPWRRRVGRTIDRDGAPEETTFIYDGNKDIAHYRNGHLQRRIINGPSLDEIVCTQENGTIFFYHYDGQGNVLALSDESGDLLENRPCPPFGEFVAADTKLPAYSFAGREYESAIGGYYFRNRYYSPALGRFLSLDPSGFQDATNLYLYGLNNPLRHTDPMGLTIMGGGGSIGWGPWGGTGGLPDSIQGVPVPPGGFPPYPSDPSVPPGPGYGWKGNGPPGSDRGAWHNPNNDTSIHPDHNHAPPKGPHVDYIDENGNRWEIYPDERILPKDPPKECKT